MKAKRSTEPILQAIAARIREILVMRKVTKLTRAEYRRTEKEIVVLADIRAEMYA
jgi:hypothetical protein